MFIHNSRSTSITVWLGFLVCLSIACSSTSAQMRESSSKAYIEDRAEVTISLAFRGEELKRVLVEPETAVIFVRPEDKRLVTQVVWRVECLMDGKVVSCPDVVEKTVISAKDGCPREIFDGDPFVIPGHLNAIASGEANPEVFRELYEHYQKRRRAMMEKDRALAASMLGCQGDEVGPAPEKADMDNGLAWQYDVTVVLEGGKEIVLDPEVWIESDEDA